MTLKARNGHRKLRERRVLQSAAFWKHYYCYTSYSEQNISKL